jgi:hypothetical protein
VGRETVADKAIAYASLMESKWALKSFRVDWN